ncbi:MAG: putative Signal transduction histidine kinase [Proteobacteria bacterium]|nr:putative Signal transduction histidine kinase [Pseudomonadota bacterium]
MTESILGRGNRIGRRLIILIILFSSAVTLIITLTQLFFDYRQQRDELDKVLSTVALHVPTIAGSVWSLDKVQTELALQALVQMPNIERASVIIRKPERQWSAGVNKVSDRVLTKTYPLMQIVRGQEQVIGSLEIVASLDAIYMSVVKHALVILFSNGIKTFLVAIFMYFAFRRIVTGRLERLADKVFGLVPEILPPSGKVMHQGGDELDALAHAFDEMRRHLDKAIEELNRSNAGLRIENGERRRAEEALQAHRNRLEEQVRERAAQIVAQKEHLQTALTEIQLIVENASLGIARVMLEEGGHRFIRKPNRTLAAMLGYSLDELEGLDARTLHPQDDAVFANTVYRDILPSGQSYRGEHRLIRKNGDIIDVWMVGTAIDPEDLSKGTIWLVDDITAQKMAENALAEAKEIAEEALLEREKSLQELRETFEILRETQSELIEREKLAALGALVAGVAHELETPIGNTLMSATTLAERSAEMNDRLKEGMKRSSLAAFLEDVGKSTEIVVRNMRRAAELVESFRKMSVDQGSSMRRTFRLKEMVEEIILVMRPTIQKTPFVIDCNIPDLIEMDSFPGPLGQVLTNLINNALIHAFDGCDHGTVHIEAHLADAEHVQLEVRDDGAGISKANLAHIFEPFFSTKFGQGGSGLGLNISRNLVTGILGGKISVNSEEGHGSRFVILLPLVAPSTQQAAVESSTGASSMDETVKGSGQ